MMESLRDYFDLQASSWDEMLKYNERYSDLEKAIQWFGLELEQWVLDVGTGTGILLPLIRQIIGPQGMLIAFDPSFKMLEKAKARSCSGDKAVVSAMAESLPFHSDLFDRIVCFSAFPHFRDKLRALVEMGRVLKAGGTLSIAHLKSVGELNDFHKRVGGPVSRDFLPAPGRMRSLMRSAGFSEIEVINRRGQFVARGKKGQCIIPSN